MVVPRHCCSGRPASTPSPALEEATESGAAPACDNLTKKFRWGLGRSENSRPSKTLAGENGSLSEKKPQARQIAMHSSTPALNRDGDRPGEGTVVYVPPDSHTFVRPIRRNKPHFKQLPPQILYGSGFGQETNTDDQCVNDTDRVALESCLSRSD